MSKISVAIADDHELVLKSLGMLIDSFPQFTVVAEALNGSVLISKLRLMKSLPAIVLLDVNMPVLDGPGTALILRDEFPTIKVAALSMDNEEKTVLQMIRNGACAYLLKESHPNLLEKALTDIATKGYCNTDALNINFSKLLQTESTGKATDIPLLTTREQEFLQLACSEYTYQYIAAEMKVSESTVETYRKSVFQKFGVQSRTGMVLEAIRRKLIVV